MAQSWDDLSEVVFGLIVDGKQSLNAVTPDIFKAPYDEMIKLMKSGKYKGIEDLIGINLSAVQTAQEASRSLNGLGEKGNWIDLLKKSHVQYEVSQRLEKAYKDLQRGKEIDVPTLVQTISKLGNTEGRLVRMSDVEAGQMKLIKTGYTPIDHWIGGIPEVGLITVIAPPKMGKTSFAIKIISKWLRKYKDKNVLCFTVEMLEKQFKFRFQEVDSSLSNDEMDRLYLCHTIESVGDLASIAATTENVSLIVVDFADLLIHGEVDTSKMEEVYRVLASLSTKVECPIILLAQLNRGWNGGVPRPNQARWTGMAEALSFMMVSLYNPSKDWNAEDKSKVDGLPIVSGVGYMAFWMCRTRTKTELPGAIQLNWLGGEAWSDNKGKWFSLEKTKADNDEEDDEWE